MAECFASADLFNSVTDTTQERRQGFVAGACSPITLTTTGLSAIYTSSTRTVADHRSQTGEGGMSCRLGHP